MHTLNTSEVTEFEQLKLELENSKVLHDMALIERAYNFAATVHAAQLRKSGQPFIIHPLTIAGYIARLNLDSVSVAAALLHDTLEDSDMTIEHIDREFGTEVAYIVDGTTTVKNYSRQFADYDETVEEVRRLIIKSAGDIRVLIIRLADKLHNALTVQYLKPEAQTRFATGVKLIFAPLAEYLGLGYFHKELQDIAFKIIDPENYEMVQRQFIVQQSKQGSLLKETESAVLSLLDRYSIKPINIYGRTKGIRSTYKKLTKYLKERRIEKMDISELFDTVALSVVTETVADCYMVLGLIHSQWHYIPEEFDDFISNPKPNGYRALKTVIEFEDGQHVEIQIKTREMHDFNEYGPASHIAYKLSGSDRANDSFAWVKSLANWNTGENIESRDYKVQTFEDSIFVFTPKGAVRRLDAGSTPIDFAFQIHTDVGLQYGGAKVNGKLVQMETELKTGDIVEIMTNKRQTYAKRDWLKFAKMRYTRYRIKKSLKGEQS